MRSILLAILAGLSMLCAAAPAPAPAPAPTPGNDDVLLRACHAIATPGAFPSNGLDRTAPPITAKPAKGQPIAVARLGTCLMRATEHDVEPPRGFARNDYSRRQPFNADESRFFVVDDAGAWHLYDALTMLYMGPLPGLGGDAEPQWHPTDPDKLYYVPRNGVGMKLMELDVRTGRSRVAADFGARLRQAWPDAMTAWTRSEGSPSADGRYWAFQVESHDWKGLGLFTYDLQRDAIIATYDLRAHGKPRPDHLSMSLTGEYVVVSFDDGPEAFRRDFTQPRRLAPNGEHSDLARDAAGNDVYVSVDYKSSGGTAYMLDLKTGKRTDLFDTYAAGTATAIHFSGRAFAKPGWVVVSTYADYDGRAKLHAFTGAPGYQWLHRKVFAVELHREPRIVPIAYTHAVAAGYFAEPHAVPNRALTHVLFNSNWDVKSEKDVDAYMAILPSPLPAARAP